VLRPREPAVVEAPAASRALQFGGEPMDGPRHLSWNFVSSSAGRIEQVKGDCRTRRFAEAPGETEFIPLPE
jgi:redox-sensitive bicupin YhaK (pirin superfamily)